ncbi:MAG: hypothetical protein WCF33_25505 [Pseudonocardiaceae bacterium]
MSTSTEPGATPGPFAEGHRRTGAVRAFSVLNGLTLLGVLLQAVWAGEFIDRAGQGTWISVHEISAFVLVVLALASALAAITLRRVHPALTLGSCGLLVLIIIQTGLGEAITKAGANELVAAHVPIAVLAFGLGVYLSSMGARLRRATA